MKSVNCHEQKRDGMNLVTGKAVYTDDIAPECLIIKILRSPHANAKIVDIDTSIALKIKGVETILTYKDVPNNLITRAGATYPEPAPLDFRILDQYVKYVGDEVAIVVGASKECMTTVKHQYSSTSVEVIT